jgi:hypothetical protein
MTIKSPIGFPASSSACGFRIGSARAAGWTPAVPGVASARSLSRAAIVVIAFGAASTAQLGATHQVVPTGCYDESASIPGCTACNQTIPPPVPCPPNDCPPTVHQPSKTEAVPVSSGGRRHRAKGGMHECSITYFRCEQGVCVEDHTRSWSVQRLIPSGTACP